LFKETEKALISPCLVVCDEGHRIKNSSANIAKTLQQIKTKRRIVLTGYPLQNNLIEYWCMVNFVRPAYLGTKSEFCNMFERPITNGQCNDSTKEDVRLMRMRAHVLHSLLEGFVQRRGHDVFINSLPKKQEFVILLKMTPVQKKLYLAFMETIGAMNSCEKLNPLRTFAMCCKIWNHPDVLYKFNLNKDADLDLDIPELQQHVIKRKSKYTFTLV
jgi:RAD54-like protein 2